MVRRLAALLGVLAICALAPAAAKSSPQGLYWFDYVTSTSPTQCSTGWGFGGCAQSGFNNWGYTTITKYSGDRIGMGFRDTGGLFYYTTYGAGGNGNTYTQSRVALGAPPYNRSFCGYYSGTKSDLDCTASL
ncbi:MAG TPA: hypothetical protein VK488_04125 [Gaiellaceae bacterium]|nr:hypothetical protein [Gaiellaceae bacterium]